MIIHKMSSHGTSRITNYDLEILTGSVADPSNTYRYKKVSVGHS